MSEDLRWLAANVHSWMGAYEYVGRLHGEPVWGYEKTPACNYNRAEWQGARIRLDLDTLEEDEEARRMNEQVSTPEEDEAWAEAERRIDVIGSNGPTGDHYQPGVKFGGAKPMMDLIPPLMELEVARVLTAGAQKYSPDNWRQVPDLRRRYIAAAKRHINALSQGIALDDETGLHHAAHAVCCLMFLGEVELETGVHS